MKIEKKEVKRVVEYEYNFTFNEEQTMILAYIMGSIGGCHPWRGEFINPLYNELFDMIDREKLEEFKRKNKPSLSAYFNSPGVEK